MSSTVYVCVNTVLSTRVWHMWILYPFSVWVDAAVWGYACGWTGFCIYKEVSFFWFHPTRLFRGEMLFSFLASQAEFSIWRSLRTQYIKLSCSNCCLLRSILSCQPSDRMSKLFFLLPSAFSICKDLIGYSCFPGVGGGRGWGRTHMIVMKTIAQISAGTG